MKLAYCSPPCAHLSVAWGLGIPGLNKEFLKGWSISASVFPYEQVSNNRECFSSILVHLQKTVQASDFLDTSQSNVSMLRMYNYKLIIFKGVALNWLEPQSIFSKSQALNMHNSRNIVSSAIFTFNGTPWS